MHGHMNVKYGNETLGFIKCGEFLDELRKDLSPRS
jgi:hypothetical protein